MIADFELAYIYPCWTPASPPPTPPHSCNPKEVIKGERDILKDGHTVRDAMMQTAGDRDPTRWLTPL